MLPERDKYFVLQYRLLIFVVNSDGIVPLTETETRLGIVSLCTMDTEDACEEIQHVEYDVLQASLA